MLFLLVLGKKNMGTDRQPGQLYISLSVKTEETESPAPFPAPPFLLLFSIYSITFGIQNACLNKQSPIGHFKKIKLLVLDTFPLGKRMGRRNS